MLPILKADAAGPAPQWLRFTSLLLLISVWVVPLVTLVFHLRSLKKIPESQKDEYYVRIMKVLRGKPGDKNPDRAENDVTVKASPAMVAVFKALQADSRDVTVECPPEMSKHLDQIREYCEKARAKSNSQ